MPCVDVHRAYADKFRLQPDKDVGARVVVLFVGTEYIPDLMEQTAKRIPVQPSRQKRIIWLAVHTTNSG